MGLRWYLFFTSLIGGTLVPLETSHAQESFHYDWKSVPDRPWIGKAFWANRLQDWAILSGRLVLTDAVGKRDRFRTVALLTHSYSGKQNASLTMSTSLNSDPGRALDQPPSVAGFLVGTRGNGDYRSTALVQNAAGPGAGWFFGVDDRGQVYVWDRTQVENPPIRPQASGDPSEGEESSTVKGVLEIDLTETQARLRFTAEGSTQPSSSLDVAIPPLQGGIAIAVNRADPKAKVAIDSVEGHGLEHHPERVFGPVLGSQYTLSRDILKITAQFPPLLSQTNASALPPVRFSIQEDGEWNEIAQGRILPQSWTATLKMGWREKKDIAYRIDFEGESWSGTIRKEPVDKKEVVLAAFTGNHNCERGVESQRFDWTTGLWFPHQDITQAVAFHNPDVLFFSGDQIYEGASPTRADRAHIELDYLYKWSLWIWAFRDLAKDRPCLCIPDDHDVYQGNLWGESGRQTNRDHNGGYVHPASFVQIVERTQTSHFPDPYDPTPIQQGIGVYYCAMPYGGVDFAVIEDRKFKSGCNNRLPDSGSKRPDHIKDPEFDVLRADVEGVTLLGSRQLHFLEDWVQDWDHGTIKVALSQTVFANVATHHGARLDYLRADLDSNGWPQTGRRLALEVLRKGAVFHVCGDQHLATVVHHGLENFRDGPWSFVVPSIANFYPRAWAPLNKGPYSFPSKAEYLGDYIDGLGNRVTVHAATNPGQPSGYEPASLHDRMPGYGIVRFDKPTRTITMECWPRYADPSSPKAHPYSDWPITIHALDNDRRRPKGFLPSLRFLQPGPHVVLVFQEDELITSRLTMGEEVEVPVFAPGSYRIEVSRRGMSPTKSFLDLAPAPGPSRTLEVNWDT